MKNKISIFYIKTVVLVLSFQLINSFTIEGVSIKTTNKQSKKTTLIKDPSFEQLKKIAIEIDSAENDFANYFLVVIDTSINYYTLKKKMLKANKKLTIPIDTLGRYYNKTKNLIALPDNHSDEIYAGEYYPRRFPSENLSLEYLDFYQKNAKPKTIALVGGIYEKEEQADSLLTILKNTEKKAFKLKSKMYIGCMH